MVQVSCLKTQSKVHLLKTFKLGGPLAEVFEFQASPTQRHIFHIIHIYVNVTGGSYMPVKLDQCAGYSDTTIRLFDYLFNIVLAFQIL